MSAARGRTTPRPGRPSPRRQPLGVNPVSGNTGGSAFAGGFFAGYNYQFSPAFVAGIEGDWTGMRATGAFNQAWTTFPGWRDHSRHVGGHEFGGGMGRHAAWPPRLSHLAEPDAVRHRRRRMGQDPVQRRRFQQRLSAMGPALNSTTRPAAGSRAAASNGRPSPASDCCFGSNISITTSRAARARLAIAPGFPANPSASTWTAPKMSVARFGMSYKF